MTYPFTTDIRDAVLGITIIPDFQCEVEVEVTLINGDLETYVRDVLVDGVSLRDGSMLTRKLRTAVMVAAEDDLSAAGSLWDAVAAAEGVSFRGAAGDPDAFWVQA
jgi:hypothetical protein